LAEFVDDDDDDEDDEDSDDMDMLNDTIDGGQFYNDKCLNSDSLDLLNR